MNQRNSFTVKIERGVMVMRNGKAWAKTYADGQVTEYGWVDPVNGTIHDPEFCKKPTDVTYAGSPYVAELAGATLVPVERKTEVYGDWGRRSVSLPSSAFDEQNPKD